MPQSVPATLLVDLRSDVRAALRALRAGPAFAVVAILTIAVGIGGNSAIFAVVRAVLLRPLPFPEADRLAIVWNDFGQGQSLPAVSGADYLDYRARAGDLAELEAATSSRANLH